MEIKAIEKSIPVQTFIAYRISEYHFHFNPTFIGTLNLIKRNIVL